MQRKKLKVLCIGSVFVTILLLFCSSIIIPQIISRNPLEEYGSIDYALTGVVEENLIEDILLVHQDDLFSIGEYIQDYLAVFGDIGDDFTLPIDLQNDYDLLSEKIIDVMHQGFDLHYLDEWYDVEMTWINQVMDFNGIGTVRVIVNAWPDTDDPDTLRYLWAEEYKSDDVHVLIFGITEFSTDRTDEFIFTIDFPEQRDDFSFDYSDSDIQYSSIGKKWKRRGCKIKITFSDDSTTTIKVDTINQFINELAVMTKSIDQVDIFDHGNVGAQLIGDDMLYPLSKEWEEITEYINDDGTVILHGCNVAEQTYLQDLANEGKVTVIAWTGKTYCVPFYIWWYVETGDKFIVEPETYDTGAAQQGQNPFGEQLP